MKEQRILELLVELEERMHNRIKELERTGLTVKNCPKCKHPVLAQAVWSQTPGIPRIGYLHQCLTCGSKFTFTEQERLVEE